MRGSPAEGVSTAQLKKFYDTYYQPTNAIAVLAAFDHEEIGSNSRSGACGPILEDVLVRISDGLGATVVRPVEEWGEDWVVMQDPWDPGAAHWESRAARLLKVDLKSPPAAIGKNTIQVLNNPPIQTWIIHRHWPFKTRINRDH